MREAGHSIEAEVTGSSSEATVAAQPAAGSAPVQRSHCDLQPVIPKEGKELSSLVVFVT